MAATSPSRNPFADPRLPTFADLIARLKADDKLPRRTRQNWVWALRVIARAVEKEATAVPAHPEFLRKVINQAAPASIGISRAAWNNARSFCGKALEWASLATMPAHYQACLAPAWVALRDKLPKYTALGTELSRFFHFCSAQGIAPQDINYEVFNVFRKALVTESIVRNPYRVYSRTAKCWNNAADLIPEWPQQRLLVPSRQRTFSLPWTAFPPSLHADVEAYMRRAAGLNLIDDHFTHAQHPGTLRLRRSQLRLLATAIVKSSVASGTLVSLRAILAPEMTASGLQYLIDRNNGASSTQISHLADILPSIARRLDMTDDDLARLRKIAKKLRIKQHGMTTRNREALRAFDDDAAVEALLTLPQRILREVESGGSKGYRRAKLVQTAVAIELLLNAPVRIQNLASIDLRRHLLEAGGRGDRELHLVFPAAEVKNANNLEFPLMRESVNLLDIYLSDWRPLLANGQNHFLFPGKSPNRHKANDTLSKQIKGLVYAYTRLDMPAHRFRHAVGKMFLDRNPGQYEIVRLLLGHKDIKTTTGFYTGTESATAARHYARTILGIRTGARDIETRYD